MNTKNLSHIDLIRPLCHNDQREKAHRVPFEEKEEKEVEGKKKPSFSLAAWSSKCHKTETKFLWRNQMKQGPVSNFF